MDPLSLIELPVRAHEAASLAEIVFQLAEGRRLSDDLRNRAAGRVEVLGLETITPYFGSLQVDPIHPNCYFLAIDAIRGGGAKPYLLRIATASAPSSGLFQKSILIGRMRPGGGREIVINCVPFGPDDHEAVRTFVREVDRQFQPRPSGAAFSIASPDANAFAGFKSLLLDTAVNAAACACDWHSGVLRAIRAGWRDGYAIPAPPLILHPDADPMDEVLARTGYTKLVLDVTRLRAGERCAAVGLAFDACVKANANEQWTWRRPDLELAMLGCPAQEVAALLAELRESGRTVQAVQASGLDAIEAVRSSGAALSLRSDAGDLREASKAAAGRVHCLASPGEDLRALARTLRS